MKKQFSQIITVLFLLMICLPGIADDHAISSETISKNNQTEFPSELVDFVPWKDNPVFTASGPSGWDIKIRERGWILKEKDGFHLWFTGFDGTRKGIKNLGYATSPDGIKWVRHPYNPILKDHWIEDLMIVKKENTYYMFAEGLNDHTHIFTSNDKVHWTPKGKVDIRYTDGSPLSPGPFGTPTAWEEDGKWYLFYERKDQGIWLATSNDMKVWTNIQDDPVMVPGPGLYDSKMIAMNQIIKHKGLYYAYFHGKGSKSPFDTWSSSIAVSKDLIHWKKYSQNPLLQENKSSNILVDDGEIFRLYSMHDEVHLHLPANNKK